MTPAPKHRPLVLRDTGITSIAKTLSERAPQIELGWSALIEELRHAGWPARTPEGDRKQRKRGTVTCICGTEFKNAEAWRYHRDETGHDTMSGATDEHAPAPLYADTTGELALTLDKLHRDREALEDLRHDLARIVARMVLIADRHRPPSTTAVPCCSVSQCDNPVESRMTDKGPSYVGMTRVLGVWVGKPGMKPTCQRHRRQRERAA